MADPEGDNDGPIRPFLFDLLGREHLAPLEIVADLGVDQNGDLQILLLGKPSLQRYETARPRPKRCSARKVGQARSLNAWAQYVS